MTRHAVDLLHIARDDKFTDLAVKAFGRACGGRNDVCVLGTAAPRSVRSPARTAPAASFLTGRLPLAAARYDAAVVHSLHPLLWNAVQRLPGRLPVVWLGFGFDYYDLIHASRDRMLLPLTRELFAGRCLSYRARDLTEQLLVPRKRRLLGRVDLFAPVLPAEYGMVRDAAGPGRFPGQARWNYGNLEEDLLGGFAGRRARGRAILVGNSAAAESNHLDAFRLLESAGVEDREVIAPLSYGDQGARGLIVRQGLAAFGARFRPLTRFLPLAEYVGILESCGFAIMSHLRQQGLGNIVILLYLGVRVFLHERCPSYAFLRDQGAIVNTTGQLREDPGLLERPLPDGSVAINREVLAANWSKAVSERRTAALLRQIDGLIAARRRPDGEEREVSAR